MSEKTRPFVQQPGGFRPALAVLNLFSSIWFGVTLLALIFAYSFVGSAGIVYPAVLAGGEGSASLNLLSVDGWRHSFPRELFDVSEMQWFGADTGWIWLPLSRQEIPPWTFRVLILLFCTAISTVTIRRIRFSVVNAGVWGIHTGIVILCIGSVIYFGRKFEGDIAVAQRDAFISVPGVTEPARMRILPNQTRIVGEGSHRYRVEVVKLQPEYEIRTEPYVGQKTYAITFSVDALGQLDPNAPNRRFLRQVLVDYPQFTEDIVMGANQPGRAAKILGKPLVDENLKIELDYSPVDEFYLNNRPALYARIVDESDPDQGGPYDDEGWSDQPLERLPRYSDRVSSTDSIWPDEAVRMPRPDPFVIDGGTLEGGVQLSVTDYLLYADIERRWTNDGERTNPMVTFDLFDLTRREELRPRSFRLFGDGLFGSRLDVFESLLGNVLVEFHWLESGAELPDLTPEVPPTVEIEIVDSGAKQSFNLPDLYGNGPQPIDGTEYQIELQGVLYDQALPFAGAAAGQAEQSSAVILQITSPTKGRFTRMAAADRTDRLNDITREGSFSDQPMDPNIKVLFSHPVPPRLMVVAGADSGQTEAVYRHSSGKVIRRPVDIGQVALLADRELGIRLTNRFDRAELETKARIVPPQARKSLADVGHVGHSLIRVQVEQNGTTEGLWLPFSAYIFDSPWRQTPRTVTLPDGRKLELLYSRVRQKLPTWVALERFKLDVYTGGMNPREFHSALRFAHDDGWSDSVWIRMNHPTDFAGHWFFQSQWEPPGTFGENFLGWNHTGLGVGNREGVYTMLAGTCLSILGMIYAFYVKPVIKRRRRDAVMASLDAESTDSQRTPGSRRKKQPSHAPADAGLVKT